MTMLDFNIKAICILVPMVRRNSEDIVVCLGTAGQSPRNTCDCDKILGMTSIFLAYKNNQAPLRMFKNSKTSGI